MGMFELILISIFLTSFAGIMFIAVKKIPALANLPAESHIKEPLLLKIKGKIKNFPGTEIIDYEVYLQKILSKVRVLMLKIEQKTAHWLEQLRQKSRQKIKSRKDKYWEELKKVKEGKSGNKFPKPPA